jgi:predicted deacylase
MTANAFFSSDYFEARSKFRLAATAAQAGLFCFRHPHAKGPTGEELFIDVAVTGEPGDTVLLAIAGTHGVEGYAGSAILTGWLKSGASHFSGIRQVLVHALNPHGFAWDRRVNEENVDLNRNFINWSATPPENRDYALLADAIAPPDLSDASTEAASRMLRNYAREHGAFAMQETISKGQYTHAAGMYYGGSRTQWSASTLRTIIDTFARPCIKSAILDFHTGLGPYGRAELISEDAPDSKAFARARAWYGSDVCSTLAGDSVSAQVFGSLDSAMPSMFSGAETTTICVEYGTQSTLEVFQALRADNWLHTIAGLGHPDREAIKAQIRKAFYPEADDWKTMIWTRGKTVLEQAVRGLGCG